MSQVFDGAPIEVGDKLLDIADERWVTVRQLYSDRFLVTLPGSQAMRTYTYKGVAARRSGKTLFWHDPRLITPKKSAQAWEGQKAFLRDVLKSMSSNLPDVVPAPALEDTTITQKTYDEARRSALAAELTPSAVTQAPNSDAIQRLATRVRQLKVEQAQNNRRNRARAE